MEFSISCTTRPRRPEDKDDLCDYEFIDEQQFDRRIKNGYFAEWAVVHGNRYGTPWNQIKKASSTAGGGTDVILDVDIKGGRSIKERFPEAFLIFVVPPSIEDLKTRLMKRNTEDKESIRQRLVSLKEEVSVIDQYDYVIVNDELEATQKEIESAIIMFKTQKNRIDLVRAAYLV